MNRVKIFIRGYLTELEDDINEFIKEKDVVNVSITKDNFNYIAIVLYRVKGE